MRTEYEIWQDELKNGRTSVRLLAAVLRALQAFAIFGANAGVIR